MKFQFPEVLTTRSEEQNCDKILDEVIEFLEEKDPHKKDLEAIDVLHTVETLLIKHFKNREYLIDELIKKVYDKNNAREYYTKKCF